MKILRKFMVLGAVAAVLASCSENDYMVYDTTQKDSVFFNYINNRNESDSTYEYIFSYNIANSFTFTLHVSVMGSVKDYDRAIKLEIVPDSSTMIEGTHYEILDATVPAGSTEGQIKINLLRDRDPELTQRAVTGRFVIGENDDLRTVKGSVFKITYSDIRPTVQPSWWLTYGPWPVYSFENAQLFFEYLYRLGPEADIDTFNNLIKTYGDYFIDATNIMGPFTNYTGFLRNYICIPLHEDHPEVEFMSDPEW